MKNKILSRGAPKYWANRCNYPFGDDFESTVFDVKSEAVKWVKSCLYGTVTLVKTREKVFYLHEGNVIEKGCL